jgi:hypothetical protein
LTGKIDWGFYDNFIMKELETNINCLSEYDKEEYVNQTTCGKTNSPTNTSITNTSNDIPTILPTTLPNINNVSPAVDITIQNISFLILPISLILCICYCRKKDICLIMKVNDENEDRIHLIKHY